VNRAIRILLILLIGGLILWESISWGSRTWVKYGLIKEPLPSITTLLPSSMIQPIITTLLITTIVIVAINGILRSRKLFGLIPLNELNRHVVVLGPTGSGKTTVAKAIASKVLTKDVSLTIIDWKGEYNQFIPTATIVRKIPNVWDIPGESAREKALLAVELVKEMSKDVVEVTPASSLLLLKVLEKEYEKGTPTTQKIIDILERNATIASKEGKYAEANMFYALARRLYVLLVDEERKDENVRGDPHIVIYDLGGLMSVYLKTLYSNYVLSKVYREAVKSRGELRALLIAEEAQNYVHPRRPNELPSLAERIIYELRAFGVGVVLVCPDSELLPQPVLKDVAVIVSMSADTLPRFALERYLFRASLEEAEDTLKKLKKSRMVVYYKGNLHYFRRLLKPPKELRLRPKGDRMGVTDSGWGRCEHGQSSPTGLPADQPKSLRRSRLKRGR
jgi:energy-coupling factor transporter ATP-binding protein EcfA2